MADKPFSEMTDDELQAEYDRWDEKVKSASHWGAALVAANNFREGVRRELDRRRRPQSPADDFSGATPQLDKVCCCPAGGGWSSACPIHGWPAAVDISPGGGGGGGAAAGICFYTEGTDLNGVKDAGGGTPEPGNNAHRPQPERSADDVAEAMSEHVLKIDWQFIDQLNDAAPAEPSIEAMMLALALAEFYPTARPRLTIPHVKRAGMIDAFAATAVQRERERCAKIAEVIERLHLRRHICALSPTRSRAMTDDVQQLLARAILTVEGAGNPESILAADKHEGDCPHAERPAAYTCPRCQADDALVAADACLAALREAGLAIVPREPTPEMSDAAFMSCGDEGSLRLTLEAGWRAMVAAAASPPEPGAR